MQPTVFGEKVLGKQPGQQDHFVENMAAHLDKALPIVHKRLIGTSVKISPLSNLTILIILLTFATDRDFRMFTRISPKLAKRIERALSTSAP